MSARIYSYNQIPKRGKFGKGLRLSNYRDNGLDGVFPITGGYGVNGLGDTLPISTLSSYTDTSGTIDSSGSNIEGLLNPAPVVVTTPSGPSITEILILGGLAYAGWYYYEHYMKKGNSIPKAKTLVKELVVPMV